MVKVDQIASVTAENTSGTETSNGFKTKGDDIKLTFKDEEGGVSTSIVGAHIHFVKQ